MMEMSWKSHTFQVFFSGLFKISFKTTKVSAYYHEQQE